MENQGSVSELGTTGGLLVTIGMTPSDPLGIAGIAVGLLWDCLGLLGDYRGAGGLLAISTRVSKGITVRFSSARVFIGICFSLASISQAFAAIPPSREPVPRRVLRSETQARSIQCFSLVPPCFPCWLDNRGWGCVSILKGAFTGCVRLRCSSPDLPKELLAVLFLMAPSRVSSSFRKLVFHGLGIPTPFSGPN